MCAAEETTPTFYVRATCTQCTPLLSTCIQTCTLQHAAATQKVITLTAQSFSLPAATTTLPPTTITPITRPPPIFFFFFFTVGPPPEFSPFPPHTTFPI